MMQADTKVDSLLQGVVLDPRQVQLQIFFVHVKEPTGIIFHAAEVDEILGCQTRLSPGRHKDDDGFCGTMVLDSQKRWPVHGLHQGTKTSDLGEAVNV